MAVLWLHSMTSELVIVSCYLVLIMTLNDVGEMYKELNVINIIKKIQISHGHKVDYTVSSLYMPLLWSEIISFTFSFLS